MLFEKLENIPGYIMVKYVVKTRRIGRKLILWEINFMQKARKHTTRKNINRCVESSSPLIEQNQNFNKR